MMMGRVFISFVLLAAVLAAPARAQDERAREAYLALKQERYEDAVAEAQTLSEVGNADGEAILAYLYENGLGVERDLQHAVNLYTKAARAGQPDAQFALGELALFGSGIERSPETAAGWYKLAARQGHARAKLRLGVMYAQGEGMPLDKGRAIGLFEEAADAGEPEAMRNLAIAYLSGDGVRENYTLAAAWFEKAAKEGDPVASYNLGLMKQSGALGATDLDAAAGHMRDAADAGFAPAMVALGLLIHDGAAGEGAPADWFERAARAGDPQGMFLYAVALAEGDGREKDPAGAVVQLDALIAMEGRADPDLLREAQRLRASLTEEKKGGFFGFGRRGDGKSLRN